MKKAQRPSVEEIGRAAQGEPSGGFNTTVYQYIEGDGNRPK